MLEKQRKRDETDRELREQLDIRQKFLEQRKKEETALEQAFIMLTQLELNREKAKIQDTTTVAKREMAQYRLSLRDLEEQRKEEDRQLNLLLDEHKRIIQKQQDEAKCKIEAAKKKLHKVGYYDKHVFMFVVLFSYILVISTSHLHCKLHKCS